METLRRLADPARVWSQGSGNPAVACPTHTLADTQDRTPGPDSRHQGGGIKERVKQEATDLPVLLIPLSHRFFSPQFPGYWA